MLSYASRRARIMPLLRLHRVKRGVAVEEQLRAVTGDGHVLPVLEPDEHASGARVHTHDAMSEAAGVRHPGHDGSGTGDGASHADAPEHASVARRNRVEAAVVRTEEHASRPGRGRRVD